MRYYAVLLKVADSEVAKKYRTEHIAYVEQLCKEEKIHLIGGLKGKGGLIIYEAEGREDVEKWVEQDPFVIHGARMPEIYEWDMHTAAQYINK